MGSFVQILLYKIIYSWIKRSIRCVYNQQDQLMGKRSNHRRGNENHGNKKVKTDWTSTNNATENQFFRAYYELQLGLSKQEFEVFWQHMKLRLPVVFRVNPNCPNYEVFRDKLESQEFLKTVINMEEFEKEAKEANQVAELPRLKVIEWYPGRTVFELNTSKQMFKKSKILSEFHKYLQKSYDSGLVSRQQLVSMLPPLFLDLKETDVVLDMCAAPGSKTSQMIQIMSGQNRHLIKGCIIANDAEYSRAQMLIHQIQRSGTAVIAAINHPGQFMPELMVHKINNIREKFQFDKILCDVPCTGDGATRKLPNKWWQWHTSDGMVLHPLQLSILMKSINLLKRGGLIVYSTCSLNPLQNQAVVSALMQKVQCGLEIVDIHDRYNFKGHRGLLKWHVCAITENKKEKKKVEEKQQKKQQQQKQQQQQQKQQQQKQQQQQQQLQPQVQRQQQKIQNKMQQQIGQQQIKEAEKEIKLEKKSNKSLKIYKDYEEGKIIQKIKQTMFPLSEQQMKAMGIDHTMRVLPHDQNSGGFYVALLKKHENFQWKYKTNNKEVSKEEIKHVNVHQKVQEMEQREQREEKFVAQNIPEVQNIIPKQYDDDQEKPREKIEQSVEKKKILQFSHKKKQQNVGSKYESFVNLDNLQFENLKQFYGLNDELKKLLFVRENTAGQRKVILVSESICKFMEADVQKKIKLVNMGCRVLQKGKETFAGNECLYRLSQQGILFMIDFINKRKIKVSIDFFRKISNAHSVAHDQIQDLVVRQTFKEMSQGSFAVYIDEIINGKKIFDAIVGSNFKNSFHLMVSRQDAASLSLRYL